MSEGGIAITINGFNVFPLMTFISTREAERTAARLLNDPLRKADKVPHIPRRTWREMGYSIQTVPNAETREPLPPAPGHVCGRNVFMGYSRSREEMEAIRRPQERSRPVRYCDYEKDARRSFWSSREAYWRVIASLGTCDLYFDSSAPVLDDAAEEAISYSCFEEVQ